MSIPFTIPDNIIFLLENKNELNSLILLKYHKLLNLSEMSEYLDRSNSNTMNYLNQLEDRNLIEIAVKSDLPEDIQQKKGPKKYYKMSSEGNKVFHQIMPMLMDLPIVNAISQQLQLSDMEFAKQTVKEVQQFMQGESQNEVNPIFIRSYLMAQINSLMEEKSYIEYSANIQQMSKLVINNLSNLVDEETKNQTFLDIIEAISPNMQINQLYHIPVTGMDDIKELGAIIVNFLTEIENYKRKKEELIESNEKKTARAYQHLYFFTGTLEESIFTEK